MNNFLPISSPYFHNKNSIAKVMFSVCIALIPGIVAYVYRFGSQILWQIVLAILTALCCEFLCLKLRKKSIKFFLLDGSAILTAILIALSFPPLAPIWLIIFATAFAIIIAKHCYGGLGQNPFNPAMVAFAVCLISFPNLMLKFPPIINDFSGLFNFDIFANFDAITSATPLDTLKTASRANSDFNATDFANKNYLHNAKDLYGFYILGLAYLLGGIYLLIKKIITWHIPVAFLSGMFVICLIAFLADPQKNISPIFHLLNASSILGAFFIATDPMSSCTTPKGKLIFGFFGGVLAAVIRLFGTFPDGVAFAVLIMNFTSPLIETLTKPKPFGK